MYIDSMIDRFIIARWCYLVGEPFLSDVEYDRLERDFKERYPESEYSLRGWNYDQCPIELLEKYGLSNLVIRTTMGYSAESIYSINKEDELETKLFSLSTKSRLSFKIDGWNTRLSYYNGILVKVETRGRSGTALDISSIHDCFPKNIKIAGRVAVTGELNIPKDKWIMYKFLTGNSDQRASVRTVLTRGDSEYIKFLAFNIFIENDTNYDGRDNYEVLKELGFTTPYFKWVSNYNSLWGGIRFMSELYKGYNYLADGLVLENEKVQYAIRLGAWKETYNTSYVIGYEEKYGMYGITIVLLIREVKKEGRTFSRINITNIATIIENNLKIGSPIAFALRSEALNVIDTGETKKLQEYYSNSYEEYQQIIDEREKQMEVL